jgi:chromate reductase
MITIISGTNRPNSQSLALSIFYQKKLKEKGIDANILSLTDLPTNILESEMYGKYNPDFQPFQDIITQTKKFIFIIPEYNGSFPGVLKLLIDTCKFPESFQHKKTALVGLAQGTYGNIRGVDHFSSVCNYVGMNVLHMRLHIPAISSVLNENGEVTNKLVLKNIEQQIEMFINF